MVGNGTTMSERSLKIREYSGREYPPDAAAINREDAKVPVSRPTLLNPTSVDRSCGAGKGGLFVCIEFSSVSGGCRRLPSDRSASTPRKRTAIRTSMEGLCRL